VCRRIAVSRPNHLLSTRAPVCAIARARCGSCATGVNIAFEGTDASSAAFSTAGQVKKLNSFSLVSLYYVAKQQFFDVKDLFVDRTGEYWCVCCVCV
jgi:hypothetical protein